MNYKTKSALTIAILLLFMVSVAVFINNLEGSITGATTASKSCKCKVNSDCNDHNPCTEDICIYPENCMASLCVHNKINGCIQ